MKIQLMMSHGIQKVAIKFASEDNPNPLKDIYFYEKVSPILKMPLKD